MEIGELKHRIAIEKRTVSINERTGEQTEVWNNYSTVWAKMDNKSGTETDKDDIATQTQRMNFVIRYIDDFVFDVASFRVQYRNKILDFISAEEMTKEAWQTWMMLKCEFKSNQ